MKNTIISLKNITVSYDGEQVLGGFDLDIHDGEFVTLLGPSGCGKTTVLRTIAGFIRPDAGDVFFYDKNITALPPHRREVNTIFQKYALFPHLNVYENIELPLLYMGISASERKKRVETAMERMAITHRSKHFPQQLSGGQQQRVAIARAVVANPKLILADEPTGNLDSKNGKEVMGLLSELKREGPTIVMVTHSQHDAGYANRIINLFDGQVVTEVSM